MVTKLPKEGIRWNTRSTRGWIAGRGPGESTEDRTKMGSQSASSSEAPFLAFPSMDMRSSLPSSLIPHLYPTPPSASARDSSTRTTLDDESDLQDSSASPFVPQLPPVHPSDPLKNNPYNFPVSFEEPMHRPQSATLPQGPPIRSDPAYYVSSGRQSQDTPPPFSYSVWREGENSQAMTADQFRRASAPGYLSRGSPLDDSLQVLPDRHIPRDISYPEVRPQPSIKLEHYPDYSQYHQLPDYPYVQDSNFQLGHDPYILPPPPPPSSRRFYDATTVAHPGGSAEYAAGNGYPTLRSFTSPSFPEDRGSLPQGQKRPRAVVKSETEQGDQDDLYVDPDQEGAEGSKKIIKKTLIACDFCRGRKLRCDGMRPSCSNCVSRENQVCHYQLFPKRRGPGKAPKGTRAKKRKVERPAQESQLSFMAAPSHAHDSTSFELEGLVPELQVYRHLPGMQMHTQGPSEPGNLPGYAVMEDSLTPSRGTARNARRREEGG
ncbi:hypothetical protein D9758_002739 [Tetrapyrgos nigripes]|uniref:Zn(2)-C6 fungal-type domain-containing protein n=1 Tax=Tetrapyrgos nigripes TaxID=182062 RepID=A0A8H5LU01_9AGAR|nr:hypothetical protein D9758_002739 [Tetrapyrgos nigripes]